MRPEALSKGVFGWNPVKLYEAYSPNILSEAIQQIYADPDSKNPAHAGGRTINLYTKAAKRKTEALAWAIFHHQQDRSRTAAERGVEMSKKREITEDMVDHAMDSMTGDIHESCDCHWCRKRMRAAIEAALGDGT